MSATDAAAWIAVFTGGVAILTQGINLLRKKRKEKDEIEVALEQQPLIREQLQLGNVGEAVKHLNVIIQSQAAHIHAQDERQTASDRQIQHLMERNDALEAEAAGWQRRYRALQAEVDMMRRDMGRARPELSERPHITPHDPEGNF